MASFLGRNGRRRRVLNEEMRSASASQTASRSAADNRAVGKDAPRYCEAASVEHHARITDFVPQRYGTFSLVAVLGTASMAGLVALDFWAASIAGALGMTTATPLELGARGSLAAWVAAVMLLATSVTCLLVYSLRRYRIDDFRGRYRIWLAAAAACLLLSVDSVAALHRVLADAASYHTGWWTLRDGAVWWLALAGVPMAWVGVRVLLDVMECRLAAAMLLTAMVLYLVGLVNYLGWGPTSGSPTELFLTAGSTLAGHWMVAMSILSYARFVLRDAQGLLARHRQPPCRVVKSEDPAPVPVHAVPEADEPTTTTVKARPTQWVDGRRPERERYDDEFDRSDRKLSKAERKQLRKLKAENRAA